VDFFPWEGAGKGKFIFTGLRTDTGEGELHEQPAARKKQGGAGCHPFVRQTHPRFPLL